MLTMLIINVIVLFLGALFIWSPLITTLPIILGFDIDAALVTGVGQFKTLAQTFWPWEYVFYGLLVILGYFAIKQVLKFFLGSRAP